MKKKYCILFIAALLLGLSPFGEVGRAFAQFTQAQKIVASDRAADDQFGLCVGISGNYAIAGACEEEEDAAGANTMNSAGSAYIYEYNGASWVQAQKIVASDRAVSDVFGATVSISGNYAIVGAMSEDEDAAGGNTMSNAGSAYIFERNGAGNWIEVQKIVASDRGAGDNFGNSVSISGNYAIVGAFFEDEDAAGGNTMSNAGSAYIFERNGAGIWTQAQKIVASDRAASDQFSWSSVSISGNYAIVGAQFEDENAAGGNTMSNAGSAYIFERNGTGNWIQVQKIVASDRAGADHFGNTVSISGSYAIAGALDEDHNATGGNAMAEAGSAYIFERNGAGIWTQAQKIVASDRAADDNFGNTVCISGSNAIVGAFQEDQDAIGGSTMIDAGSAYIFQRNGAGVWTQAQKIVASDRAADDHLGHFEQGTSIDGSCAIIGSHQEDQDATGANTKSMSGSAYIFCSSPTILNATISPQNILCYGQCTGTATANSVGGTGTHTYLWNTSPVQQTTQVATGLCAGSYTVTVTDGTAATTTATVTITQPALALTTSIASVTNATCNALCNGSATVNQGGGTPNYTYLWINAPGQTTANAAGLCAGSYTATVTDANGCTSTQTVTITEPAAITTTVIFTAATCGNNDGTATANAGGGTGTINYSWAPTGQTTPTATGLSGGVTYTVTITDANNCTKTANVTITTSNGPNVTLAFQTNVLCNGQCTGSAAVAAAGGSGSYTYLWNPAVAATAAATGLCANNYTITVTDSQGCVSIQTVTITEPPALTATPTFTAATCGNNDGTAHVNANGGTGTINYSWMPTGQTTPTATGLSGGVTYTVTATDASNCTKTANVTITISNGPNVTLASQTNVLCNGYNTGSATVNAGSGSPPYTYLWNTTPAQNTSAANGLSAGNYVATVTDASGCTSTQTVAITEPTAITATVISTPALCDSSNGDVTVNAGGGTGTFSVVWNPTNQTTPTAIGLAAGSYTVTITDANGCSSGKSVDVTEIDCPCPAFLNLTIPIPNAFSPNRDGENDMFCLDAGVAYCIKELKIIIYNRWGEKVFQSYDPKFCWDGFYKDNLQNTAVFVYYLEATLLSGKEIKKKGNVSLLR